MSILKNVTRLTEEQLESPAGYQDGVILTYNECVTITNRCIAESTKANLLMNIAIADHTGNLLFFYRMTGAWQGSVHIAQAKAYTAFAFSGDKDKQGPMTTEALGKACQPGKPLFGIQSTDSNIVIFGGGIPLYRKNILIGALGISGSSVENDITICSIGAKAFS